MQEIEQIVNQWREEVLAPICNECPGYCCASNISNLTEEQLRLIFSIKSNVGDEIELVTNKDGRELFQRNEDGTYSTNYGFDDVCPQWEDGNCKIHDDPLRPNTCKQCPVYIYEEEGGVLLINNHPCPATETLEYTAQLCLDAMDHGLEVRNMFGLPEVVTRMDALYSRSPLLRRG